MFRIVSALCVLCAFVSCHTPAAVNQKHPGAPRVAHGVWGVQELPSGNGPFAAVILLHGSSGFDDRYPKLAQDLANAGFAALALDYYAEAGPSPIHSNEKLRKWPRYQAAVRKAVDYMNRLPNVGNRPIALLGFSRGAFLAVSTAASLPRVKAVVDFFGGGGGGTQSLEEDAQGLPPLLILHGDADEIVPVRFAYALQEASLQAGGSVEMHIYPGEGHGLSDTTIADGIRRTITFLKRHLGR